MQTLSVKCNTNGIHMKQEHFSHTAHIQHVTYIVVHALYEQNVRIYIHKSYCDKIHDYIP